MWHYQEPYKKSSQDSKVTFLVSGLVCTYILFDTILQAL